MKTVPKTQGIPSKGRSSVSDRLSEPPNDASLDHQQPHFQHGIHIPLGLVISQEDQALCYYSQHHVEVPNDWPAIADRWDNHLKHALSEWSLHRQQSVLGLAILAVSHASFGRTRHDYAALAAGSQNYSKALIKTNTALANQNQAISDEVLLAVMLLSFYENVVLDKTPFTSGQDIESIGSRAFAHHDGAVAMLKLRQQSKQRTGSSTELDRLVRRQLMRTLLLRCMPVPSWLRSGKRFGEQGLAFDLEHFMVRTAELRHIRNDLSADFANPKVSVGSNKLSRLSQLLADARTLDDILIIWADRLPVEFHYSTITVHNSVCTWTSQKVFDRTVHIYSTAGHASVWNRWRSLRLILNDIMFKISPTLTQTLGSDTALLEQAARSRVHSLVADLCASVPYILGFLKIQAGDEGDLTVDIKVPASLKEYCNASVASTLCWPLNEAIMVSEITERHRQYLKDRILDVSEIVDDGIMERIAADFSTSANISTVQ